MRILDILEQKGRHVITIRSDHTIHEAMRAMVDHQIGSLVVEDQVIDGIITERDILRFATARPRELDTTRVADVMTRDVVVAVPEDSLDYVMGVMTRNRIRHLPIVEEGRLAGLVSMGDVVDALREDAQAENRYMHEYIAGVIA